VFLNHTRDRLEKEACAREEANEEVKAEYANASRSDEDMGEEEVLRMLWRLRVTQESHRAPEALQRPRQPRSSDGELVIIL
jgi:predicted ribosome quality control (RQC) complex YloA/Tae2 family protein